MTTPVRHELGKVIGELDAILESLSEPGIDFRLVAQTLFEQTERLDRCYAVLLRLYAGQWSATAEEPAGCTAGPGSRARPLPRA